jgi:hypothetical protein
MELAKETLAKLRTAKSFEDFYAILKETDGTFSAEEAGSLYEKIQSPPELSDEELEQVAGGISGNAYFITKTIR